MDKVKQSMKEKVPEIKRSLELVKHLQERQVDIVDYGVASASGMYQAAYAYCLGSSYIYMQIHVLCRNRLLLLLWRMMRRCT